ALPVRDRPRDSSSCHRQVLLCTTLKSRRGSHQVRFGCQIGRASGADERAAAPNPSSRRTSLREVSRGLGPPEWLVAFVFGVSPALAEVLKFAVAEGEKQASFARALDREEQQLQGNAGQKEQADGQYLPEP